MTDKDDVISEEMANSRRAIAESRSEITKKLGMLEDHVRETVDGVKESFDLRLQVQRHPWLVVAGAVAAGFAVGRMGVGATSDRRGKAYSGEAPPRQESWSAARPSMGDNIAAIKGDILQMVVGTLWSMAKQMFIPGHRNDGGPISPPRAETASPRVNGHIGN